MLKSLMPMTLAKRLALKPRLIYKADLYNMSYPKTNTFFSFYLIQNRSVDVQILKHITKAI